jgi:hypothetical protein
VRTVRSAAWSRNRPRGRVAWLLLVILLVLIALVARVDSAPGSAEVDPARRHAEAGSRATQTAGIDEEEGEESDGERDDDEDRASGRAAIANGEDGGEHDGADDEDIADDGVLTERELGALAGEIAPAEASLLGTAELSRDRAVVEAAEARESANLAGVDDDGARTGLGLDDGAGALAGLELDDGDGALAGLGLGEDAAGAGAVGAGALAMLDAELAPGDEIAGLDAADAGATAGAEEAYEQQMRHGRPSPWGRLDVGVSWRRRWSEPVHTPASRHDEIWLVATWRR